MLEEKEFRVEFEWIYRGSVLIKGTDEDDAMYKELTSDQIKELFIVGEFSKGSIEPINSELA